MRKKTEYKPRTYACRDCDGLFIHTKGGRLPHRCPEHRFIREREVIAAWKLENAERARANEKAWRERNPEKVKEATFRWNQENGEELWDRHLRRNYGITSVEYDQMLAEQDGVCYICGDPPLKRRLHVDHCHATGRVRRLLCPRCNTGLGTFRDDPDLLEAAARYLRTT